MKTVQSLTRAGWEDARIECETGMEQDEILRLRQMCGLRGVFAANDFSQARVPFK